MRGQWINLAVCGYYNKPWEVYHLEESSKVLGHV